MLLSPPQQSLKVSAGRSRSVGAYSQRFRGVSNLANTGVFFFASTTSFFSETMAGALFAGFLARGPRVGVFVMFASTILAKERGFQRSFPTVVSNVEIAKTILTRELI